MLDEPLEFAKLAEQRAEKLAKLHVATGDYSFETCQDCEQKVLKLIKDTHYYVQISSAYPIELEELAEELDQSRRKIGEELMTHRNQVEHGPKKSPDEKLIKKLLQVLAEYEGSSR